MSQYLLFEVWFLLATIQYVGDSATSQYLLFEVWFLLSTDYLIDLWLKSQYLLFEVWFLLKIGDPVYRHPDVAIPSF